MLYYSINNFKESVNLKGKTMDQLEITKMLNDLNIPFRVVEHPAAMTIEEIDRFALPNSTSIRSVPNDTKERDVLIKTYPALTCGTGTSSKIVSPFFKS